MNIYFSKLIHLFFIFYLSNPMKCENYHRRRNQRCEPSCLNRIDESCNKFEIQLRATMMKCNALPNPFKSSTTRPETDACTRHFDCTKKIHVTMKLLNEGETEVNNQYVIVDHVTDSNTGNRVSLLNPYVIVMRQKPILQLYGLKKGSVVNGEAQEEIINKKNPNFMGCDDMSITPTCGNLKFNGDTIPYSQGFCCSCDEKKNFRRQPRSIDPKHSAHSNSTMNIHELIYKHLNWEAQHSKEFVRKKKSVESWDFNDYRSLMRHKDNEHLNAARFPKKTVNPLFYKMNNRAGNMNSKSGPSMHVNVRGRNKRLYFKRDEKPGKSKLDTLQPVDVKLDDIFTKQILENEKSTLKNSNNEMNENLNNDLYDKNLNTDLFSNKDPKISSNINPYTEMYNNNLKSKNNELNSNSVFTDKDILSISSTENTKIGNEIKNEKDKNTDDLSKNLAVTVVENILKLAKNKETERTLALDVNKYESFNKDNHENFKNPIMVETAKDANLRSNPYKNNPKYNSYESFNDKDNHENFKNPIGVETAKDANSRDNPYMNNPKYNSYESFNDKDNHENFKNPIGVETAKDANSRDNPYMHNPKYNSYDSFANKDNHEHFKNPIAVDTAKDDNSRSNPYNNAKYKSVPRISTPNIQIRGGQDCDDGWTPLKKNPDTYQDSAHCLRFSNIWFGSYQVSEPVLDHSVMIKIFEKREMDNGNTDWIDITGGKTIRVGSLNPKYEDIGVTVSYDALLHMGMASLPFALDPRTKRLLIPEEFPKMGYTPREAEGGPAEYLVVDINDIQTSGDLCDTAGVGYSAFYNQPNRCSMPRGTCLKNQPNQLWRSDKKACSECNKGKYFLKNYAVVPDNALRRTDKDTNYLALHFSDTYRSTLDIDIKADDNIIFSGIPQAKITEVYVDSTIATVTVLTIKIHNNGLVSNIFRPRLADCPLELPVEWGNLEGDAVLIPPQHHSTYTLRLLGILPVKNFYCSVEVITTKNEVIAVRRIRIVKYDRCICAWHCLCACYLQTGLGCVLMSMEHYKAAGFVGSMPLGTTMVKVSYFEQVLFGFIFFTMLLVIILLLMGLTKALIGYCFFVPVGIWGLDVLIGLRIMDHYYEDCLKCRTVVYDCDGWPVHPDTRQRTVRIVDDKVEFCLNVIFFFTYPVMLFLILASKLCCPYYTYYGDEDKGVFFQSVNTMSYAKCQAEPKCSKIFGSDSEGCEDMFEFEEYEFCTSD